MTIALIILWATTWSIFIFTESKKPQTIEIPSNIQLVVVINSTQTLIDVAQRLGTDENYQPLYEKLLAVTKEQKGEPLKEKMGVNILKPIVLVTTNTENSTSRYLMVDITNEKDFRSMASQMNVTAIVKENKGFLVLSGNFKLPQKFKHIQQQSGNLLNVYSRNNEKLILYLKDNQLNISGSIPYESSIQLSQKPTNKGLFLQMLIPSIKLDKNLLPQDLKALLENIAVIAVDYEGGGVSKQGFYPIINTVFSVKNTLDIEQLRMILEKIPMLKFYDYQEDNYRVIISGQKYILKKLNDKEWFFGMNESSLIQNKTNEVFTLKGGLSYLTTVKGSVLVSAGLNFIPGFTPTKRFLNKIDETNITIIQKNDDFEINGQVIFKEGTNIGLEILSYSLDMMDITRKK